MVPVMAMTSCRRPGAFVFRLEGMPDNGPLLVDAPANWPELTVVREAGCGRPETEELTADHARLWLASGRAPEVDRAASRARQARERWCAASRSRAEAGRFRPR